MSLLDRILADVDRSDGVDDASAWVAHCALRSLHDDITTDDGRAREGLGLSRTRPTLSPEEMRVLSEYISTH